MTPSRFRRPAVIRLLPVYLPLGIVGAVMGTLCAYIAVPVDPEPAGALFLPAALMTVGLIAAPVAAFATNASSIFRIENSIPCGLVFWLLLDLLQGSYDVPVPQDAVRLAFVAIGLFAVCFWAGTTMGQTLPLPGVLRTVALQNPSPARIFTAIVVAFILGIFYYAISSNFNPIAMVYGLTQDRFSAPWSRAGMGGWNAFLEHLIYFGYILPTLTVMFTYRLGRWVDWRVLVSVAMCLILTAFSFQGGSRRIIGTTYGAAVMCWLLLQSGRVTISTHLRLLGVVAAILVLMQAMIEVRGEGILSNLQSDGPTFRSETLKVDDNFLRLSQIIDWFPDRYDYVKSEYVVWVAIRPIPRVFWPGKPISPGFDHGEAVGNSGTSLTSSVIGESFMSYGWPAVVVAGVFYGFLAGMYSKILTASQSPGRVALYGMAAMAVFAGLRSMIELLMMSYMLLAWISISLMLGAEDQRMTNPVAPAGR